MPKILAGRPGPDCVPWSIDELQAAEVGGVVSLDGPIRTQDLRRAGIEHLPVYQPMLLLQQRADQERFLRVMPKIIPFIDQQRERERATLIHCFYGCDRTGAALACYLIARAGHTADEAITAVQKVHPEALWALGYMEVIHTFEELLVAKAPCFEGLRVV